MKAEWKIVPRGDVQPQYSGLYVTMNPMGDICMNRWTYERFDSPGAFLVMYDEVNNRIGLQPTSPSMKHAYPVRSHNRTGARKIRGHRLTREHGIKLPVTMHFADAYIDDDGILILDLRTAKPSKRAEAWNRRRSVRGK